MVVLCPHHGGWMGRSSFLTCSLPICQMDPVPKLQTLRSPGTGLLALEPPLDPGAESETIAGCQQCIF